MDVWWRVLMAAMMREYVVQARGHYDPTAVSVGSATATHTWDMYAIFEPIIQGQVLCHIFAPVTLGHEFQLLQPGLDAQVRIRLLGLSTSMEHYVRSGGVVTLDNAADFMVEINQGKWSDEDL